jgi:hypothetical protein
MEGATLKRWQPVSRGRAHPILKRTSHIKVILESQGNQPKLKTKISSKPKTKNVKKSQPSSTK